MKLRTMLFISAFLLAVGVNFAFTTKNQEPTYGYYYDRDGLCDYGQIYEDWDCKYEATGPECTIFDDTTGLYKPAYAGQESEFECDLPLYKWE